MTLSTLAGRRAVCHSAAALALLLAGAEPVLAATAPPAAPAAAAPALAAPTADSITIRLLPAPPIIERGRHDQRLNFDLLLESRAAVALELAQIEVTVLGADDRLIAQRRLGQNGGSIALLPNRLLPAGGRLVIFNPFFSFEPELDLGRLRYDLTFATPDGVEPAAEVTQSVRVEPRQFAPAVRLQVPVKGKVFVHDGHDYVSHHRRLDVTGDMTTALGINSNMTRYAYDFVVTDEAGRMYRGDGSRNEDWYGFGVPVLAPGDGVVREAVDGIPDNRKDHPEPIDYGEVMRTRNIKRIFGNYILLEHAPGEYSLLAHLKNGSVEVKAGERVRAGATVAGMGFSGDAFLVHLHYQLQSDDAYGEGLPSPFHDFRLLVGDRWVDVPVGAVDSGDVVESRAPAPQP